MTLTKFEKEVETLLTPILEPLGLSFSARETTTHPGNGKGAHILMVHDPTFPDISACVTVRETDDGFAIVPANSGRQVHFAELEILLPFDAAYRQTVSHLAARAPEVRQSIDRILHAPKKQKGKPEPQMSVADLSETLWKKP